GRRRIACHGKGPATAARNAFRASSGRLRGRQPSRCPGLLLSLPALGLAAPLLPRRFARAARLVRSLPRQRIGSLATNPRKNLERTRPRYCLALEAVSVPYAPDEHDELCVARYPGYVPHIPRAPMAFRPLAAFAHDRDFDDWRDSRRYRNRSSFGSLRTPPHAGGRSGRRSPHDPVVGLFALHGAARRRCVSDPVHGARRVGHYPRASRRALARFRARIHARIFLPMRSLGGGI